MKRAASPFPEETAKRSKLIEISLETIPDDALVCILSHLSIEDLVSSAVVNKKWNKCIKRVWSLTTQLNITLVKISSSQLRSYIVSCGKNLTSLKILQRKLSEDPEFVISQATFDNVMRTCTNLEQLELCLSQTCTPTIKSEKLTSLALKLKHESQQFRPQSSPYLPKIDCPNLRSFTSCRTVLWGNLLVSIISVFTSFVLLVLNELTVQSILKEINANSPLLNSIEVIHSTFPLDSFFQFPSLRHLHVEGLLSNNPNIRKENYMFQWWNELLSMIPNGRLVSLTFTEGILFPLLFEVFSKNSHLKFLHIEDCEGYASHIRKEGRMAIRETFKLADLTDLSLAGCHFALLPDVFCPHLQRLNFSRTEIDDALIQRMVASPLQDLTSLDISYCTQLKKPKISKKSFPSLAFLNVTGVAISSKGLQKIFSDTPSLKEVTVSARHLPSFRSSFSTIRFIEGKELPKETTNSDDENTRGEYRYNYNGW